MGCLCGITNQRVIKIGDGDSGLRKMVHFLAAVPSQIGRD